MLTYSVITACLNSEKTLNRAIDSVFRQKILPYEYIFVDGGSSDKTLDIIENANAKSKDAAFNVIKQTEKTGIYGAFNLGIKAATTDFIFILNADDWYEPDALKTVMSAFNEDKQAEIVTADAYFVNPDGKKKLRQVKSFNLLPFLMPVIHPACFVRKSVYEKIGLYDQSYKISADYEFIYRCIKNKINFKHINKPLVNMQLGGTANANRKIARKETRKIGKQYSSFPLLPNLAFFARTILGR